MVKREIESCADGRIDRPVYELYGLTEEEVRIVDMYNAVHSLFYSTSSLNI